MTVELVDRRIEDVSRKPRHVLEREILRLFRRPRGRLHFHQSHNSSQLAQGPPADPDGLCWFLHYVSRDFCEFACSTAVEIPGYTHPQKDAKTSRFGPEVSEPRDTPQAYPGFACAYAACTYDDRDFWRFHQRLPRLLSVEKVSRRIPVRRQPVVRISDRRSAGTAGCNGKCRIGVLS